MPEFTNPFIGITPDRTLSLRELTRAIRLSLSAEQEAIHLYEAIADATSNELARRVMQDVADEEREHVGEFQKLLDILVADEQQLLAHGAAEVEEMAAQVAAAAKAAPQGQATIGSLREEAK